MKYVFILLLVLNFIACQNTSSHTFDETIETEKILALHNEQRRVHFEKLAEEFVNQFSDNFISVNRGKVTVPKREDNIIRFQNYFNSVEFVKWDDIKEPIIRFSDDGSMAYTIVEKEVVVRYENGDELIENTTIFSWMAVYKKYNAEWKVDAIASTNLPDVSEVVEKEVGSIQ